MATDFEEHRPHLLRVGYRITGSLADAEDAVQEAWFRWSRASDVREPRAWLTTVVARICLDRLTSATARRETYVGPWLPEPLVTAPDDEGPLAAVVRGEDVRLAAVLLLDRLTPAQRVAFVLHEALGTRYAEIGEVLGCSADAARQHAAAARRSLASAPVPARAPAATEQRVLAEFGAALARGDWQAVVSLLHPDITFTSDGGGRVATALRPLVGADKVGRFLAGLFAKYSFEMSGWTTVLVNGEPGLATPAADGVAASVTAFTVDADGRITAARQVMNPDKLHPWW
ncbi:RNA polymerase sigma factor SigJ [Pseudonocardia sp. WMMC193]|uniref:RNA polymerase sigma factor SigJ n=1 Tax=Pseudonocardia sp. WMMC193 TaxID=2911965 RepID=UPI001F02730A|nr:RNA polymerase sigma factor SigJ [Pseudonocardia sp. WMMC193]MCF7547833.1 RNA polymerase sigma factor SigJ [Pseudonocardia sp. WMMC193]